MAEIRNLTRNGETFYPLTHVEGLLDNSGNVVGEINDIFDISEYNASGTPPVLAKYATLDLALAAVPQSKQKGGMTVRYVQTSDNKYVQYRLMNNQWSTTPSDWQGVDDVPTAGSNNFVKSGGVKSAIDAVDALMTNIIPVQYNDALIQDDYIIPSGTNKWLKIAGAKSIVYPLTGSGTIRVTPKSGVTAIIYTLSEFSAPVSGESAHVNHTIYANIDYSYDANANDKYLYILLYYNSLRLPESIKIGTYDILKDLKQNVDADYNYKDIPDGSITPAKLSATFDETRIGILYYNGNASMAFDFTAKTCTIPAGSRIFYCSKPIILANVTTVLDLTHDFEGSEFLSYGGGAVVYDIANNVFKIIKNSYATNNRNFILIATYQLSYKRVNSPSWFTVDGKMYGVENKQNFSTISPCFELITLPTDVTWWSDFIPITINGVDELWLFKNSSDENHKNNDGVIYRVKMSDWTLLGSITHNFGHCNTVHYDDVHDTLLIGNLPGTQSLPSALYIFYNVSSWASESSLDFDTISPSIVDVHDVVDTQLAAFWADNGISIRNQVYIMKAYGVGKFAKIVLGMGTNQLTYGTYDSTHSGSDQFNGTYDIVIAGVDIQYPSNDGNKNVIQGGDYAKGRVITANGHDQIYGRIWAIQENVDGEKSINSTFIECVPRKADGTIDYSVGEGLCVKDGYVYHGIIKMTDDFRHTPQTVTGYYLAKYPLPY